MIKVYIKRPNGKELTPFKFPETIYIDEVKESLGAKFALDSKEFQLLYAGKVLKDDKSLRDSFVQDNSVLTMLSKTDGRGSKRQNLTLNSSRRKNDRTVKVKWINGNMIDIKVSDEDTVDTLKGKISAKTMTPSEHFSLFLYSRKLLGSQTIGELELRQGALILVIKNRFPIIVQNVDFQSRMTVNVSMDDQFKLLKKRVASEWGIPLNMVSLAFKGKFLQDNEFIQDTKIKENEQIQVVENQSLSLRIVFQEESFPLDCRLHDSLLHLKQRICHTLDLETYHYRFIANGMELRNDKTLQSSGLSKDTKIFLLRQLIQIHNDNIRSVIHSLQDTKTVIMNGWSQYLLVTQDQKIHHVRASNDTKIGEFILQVALYLGYSKESFSMRVNRNELQFTEKVLSTLNIRTGTSISVIENPQQNIEEELRKISDIGEETHKMVVGSALLKTISFLGKQPFSQDEGYRSATLKDICDKFNFSQSVLALLLRRGIADELLLTNKDDIEEALASVEKTVVFLVEERLLPSSMGL